MAETTEKTATPTPHSSSSETLCAPNSNPSKSPNKIKSTPSYNADEEGETGQDMVPPEETNAQKKNERNEDQQVHNADETDPNEVTWDGPNDPQNPQNMSMPKKWLVTMLCALFTLNVTFSSSAPASANQVIAEEFGISVEVVTLSTSLFLLGFVAGPFLWAPFSERYGRRIIFIISLFAYWMLQLPGALCPNIQTLLVCRFFAGFFSSSPITNGGGCIADVHDALNRGRGMTFFSSAVLMGPVIGPLVGGFVTTSYLKWRFIFWCLFSFAGLCWVLCVLFLPETFAPFILSQKAKRLRKEDPEKNKDLYAPLEKADTSWKATIDATLLRPFVILSKEPILVLITIYISVVYGILYSLFESFPVIWTDGYGFSDGKTGLVFIGIGIGVFIGSSINLVLMERYKKLIPAWKGVPPPENRLPGAMIGGPLLVIGIFFLGWTGFLPEHIPWYVPALATPFLGAAFVLLFVPFLSFIVDSYMAYAASGLAANTIVRSAVGAGFPLFTVQMFNNLGIQWACTLLGCISLLLAPIPALFFVYGARIRQKSKFAPNLDLKIKKEMEEEKRRNAAGEQQA